MAASEIQLIEANLDIVTDYDGNLLEPMTTPVHHDAEVDKVNCSQNYFCILPNCAPVALVGIASRNLGTVHPFSQH